MSSTEPVPAAQPSGSGQPANLLGALALRITDEMSAAVVRVGASSDSSAAALSAMLHFLDAPSIDLLRRVLGLTSSGAVRLVDRLVDAGDAVRGSGRDGRETSVRLTPAGRARAERVAAARGGVLADALAGLSPEERTTFGLLAGKILAGMIRPPGAVRWTCRLCDTAACGRAAGRCPVANAAFERHPQA